MSRADGKGVSLDRTYPSVVAGAFAIAVWALTMMVLSRIAPTDPEETMVHFTAGFLVFMVFYFVVMIFAEPYLRW